MQIIGWKAGHNLHLQYRFVKRNMKKVRLFAPAAQRIPLTGKVLP